MYNQNEIKKLVEVIEKNNGIGDKGKLADIVQGEFALEKERKAYTGKDFAIRFSKANSKKMSNTVLSLSALQKYDDKPFFVCIVTPTVNYLLLANTTFLKKISHSSQQLRIDNIKGSFNGSDIYLEFEGMENEPKNFQKMFEYHEKNNFEENLIRLIRATNHIVARLQKFDVTPEARKCILESLSRTIEFVNSKEYMDLQKDLDARVAKVQEEIVLASHLPNLNTRGRAIEFLITDNGSLLKEQICEALREHKNLPPFSTADGLGDYTKDYSCYHIEIDIKSKLLFHSGNPKAYNIDKLLEFLASEKSVYMIYLIGIEENGNIITRLCSIYDIRILQNAGVQYQWAGRNSRGVAQFIEKGLLQILKDNNEPQIEESLAREFLEKLINL